MQQQWYDKSTRKLQSAWRSKVIPNQIARMSSKNTWERLLYIPVKPREEACRGHKIRNQKGLTCAEDESGIKLFKKVIGKDNAWWIPSWMGTGPKSAIIISLSKNRIRKIEWRVNDCRVSGWTCHFVLHTFQGFWSTKDNKSICQLMSNTSVAP